MLIPIKCFTCGKVIANKYFIYLQKVEDIKKERNIHDKIEYLDTSEIKKTVEGEVLDELNLKDICCRRHFLTHVDIL
tara:strand:+ start:1156 stop:1386 length:231 start_codon:yes stop_codon:yes gene_type:complete